MKLHVAAGEPYRSELIKALSTLRCETDRSLLLVGNYLRGSRPDLLAILKQSAVIHRAAQEVLGITLDISTLLKETPNPLVKEILQNSSLTRHTESLVKTPEFLAK